MFRQEVTPPWPILAPERHRRCFECPEILGSEINTLLMSYACVVQHDLDHGAALETLPCHTMFLLPVLEARAPVGSTTPIPGLPYPQAECIRLYGAPPVPWTGTSSPVSVTLQNKKSLGLSSQPHSGGDSTISQFPETLPPTPLRSLRQPEKLVFVLQPALLCRCYVLPWVSKAHFSFRAVT